MGRLSIDVSRFLAVGILARCVGASIAVPSCGAGISVSCVACAFYLKCDMIVYLLNTMQLHTVQLIWILL